MKKMPRKYRRVIDVLRDNFPGSWNYNPKLAIWESFDRKQKCHAIHIGGVNENGEALPGAKYYIYDDDNNQVDHFSWRIMAK